MSNETPAESLADIAQRIVNDAMPATRTGATCFVPRYQLDQLSRALEAERSLAAGKVATVCLTPTVYAGGHMMDLQVQVSPGTTVAIGDKLYTAPPADPAKASEPEEVRIDFPGIGHAGPFPVASGQITLPAATMSDLAHHFRMGYVAKASGSAPDDIDTESADFKEGFAVGRAESEHLCEMIKNPTCHRCGATSAKDAETKCRPGGMGGDECPGTEWPLSKLWASAPEVTKSMVELGCRAICRFDNVDPDEFDSVAGRRLSFRKWEAHVEPVTIILKAALQQEGKSHDQ